MSGYNTGALFPFVSSSLAFPLFLALCRHGCLISKNSFVKSLQADGSRAVNICIVLAHSKLTVAFLDKANSKLVEDVRFLDVAHMPAVFYYL